MLYPIELLRQMPASMVTAGPLFVMSRVAFLTVRRRLQRPEFSHHAKIVYKTSRNGAPEIAKYSFCIKK